MGQCYQESVPTAHGFSQVVDLLSMSLFEVIISGLSLPKHPPAPSRGYGLKVKGVRSMLDLNLPKHPLASASN